MTTELFYKTEGNPFEIINIAPDLEKTLSKSKIKEGLLFIFCQSTTSGLNIIEFEKGHIRDIEEFLESLIPKMID